ncbi:MAG: sulfatase, partial [Gemmatimonadetes bacterium]|nr:sulfatase [Gemmatimonadota bacterium]
MPAALLLPGLFFALACAPAPAGNGRSVLLITLDTTRADRIGVYGGESASTPSIDALARRGVLFERAYASIPVTLPSHTTILTGLYPHEHGVRDNGVYRVPDELTTLAEVLRDRDYRTGAFVSAHVLHSQYRIDQGFTVFDDEMVEPLRVQSPVPRGAKLPEHTKRWIDTWSRPYQRRAETTVERALEWLGADDGTDAPFFCWVHLFDPHLSYEPPAPYDTLFGDPYDGPVDGTGESFHDLAKELQGRIPRKHLDRMISLYDGEISYADEWIGRLLAAVPDSTLVVFTADHGEALGEHGQFFEHQMTIYEETMRVPLVVAGPGVPGAGVRRTEPAGSVDVFPTVLGLLGLRGGGDVSGVDLFGPGATEPRPLYGETRAALTAVPTPTGYRGVRENGWALIREIVKPDRIQKEQLFHTVDDPA